MNLNIYYQNAQGLRTKLNEFYLSVLSCEFQIICITESWCKDHISDSELFPSSYNVYRSDRNLEISQKRDGGGVLVAVTTRLSSFPRPSWSTAGVCEYMWVTVGLTTARNLNICCVYIPPYAASAEITTFMESIGDILDSNTDDEFLVVGDFNLPNVIWTPNGLFFEPATSINDIISVEFINLYSFLNLYQFNGIANESGKFLDLVISGADDHIFVSRSAFPLVAENMHHPSLAIDLKFEKVSAAPVQVFFSRAFPHANYDLINIEIKNIDWSVLNSVNVNEAVKVFYSHIYKVLDKHVPLKQVNKRDYPSWYSASTIAMLREKAKFHKKWKRFENLLDYNTFSDLRRRSKASIREDYKAYLQKVETNLQTNIKHFWSYVSSKRKRNIIPVNVFYNNVAANSGPEICSHFLSFFKSVFEPSDQPVLFKSLTNHSLPMVINEIKKPQIVAEIKKLDSNKGSGPDGISPLFIKSCVDSLLEPLYIIFNKSLHEGVFPDRWKHANVLPIYKTGDKSKVENYRPISLLSAFGKLLEAIVASELFHLARDRITPQQHGFFAGRSTSTNLVSFIQRALDTMDSRRRLDAVYTDFSKAFDKVHHATLLVKLGGFGVHGSLLRWFESYISFRTMCVTVNNYKSEQVTVTSGVPQGSHLGPLLFSVFVNDIATCFEHSEFLMYADDLKIFKVIETSVDSEDLQADLNALVVYCQTHRLNLNLNKCNQITFSRLRSSELFQYYLDSHPLAIVTEIKDLGILLDCKLTFESHVVNIVKAAYKSLGFVKRITQEFKDKKSVMALYNSLVRSRLEYAAVVWNPQYYKYIHMIEAVQKRYIKFVNYKFNRHLHHLPYPTQLSQNNLIKLSDRRLIIDMIFLYKLVNGFIDSSFLVQNLNFYCGSLYNTRSPNLFRSPSFNTLSCRNSPSIRLMRTYDNLFSHVDLFESSLVIFRRSLVRTLS